MAITFDAKKNFAYSLVSTPPSPATTGTTLVLEAGKGALFPAAPFNVTVWPVNVQPTAANAEIVRVTDVTDDTLTIEREQEGTSARTIEANDQVALNITALTLTDIQNALETASLLTTPIGSVKIWPSEEDPGSPWLMCQGQAISRSTYSALFAVYGTTHGEGDGSTTFNLPNMRQRMPIGQAESGDLSIIGALLGSWDHTHGPGTLAVAAHTHGSGTLVVASHTHGPGTLATAAHTHGPGTLTVANHSHTLSNHTHSMQNHTHGFAHTHGTGGPSGTVSNNDDGGNVAAHASHTHQTTSQSTSTTGGPSNNTTGTPSDNNTGGTAPAVSGGTTGSTAAAVNSGVTDATAPAVSSGATGSTAPAVDAGVTDAGNGPVIVVNYIVRALSGIF